MKILKDNYNGFEKDFKKLQQVVIKPYPRKLTCEQCGSKLEYDESDLRMGALGCCYVDCPCCGMDNMLEENENAITLTKDNIIFPTHFFHTSTENGAVDNCNEEEIKKCIQRGIDYFRKNKEEFAWNTQCGNLYLAVFRYEGDEDYEIMLANDFYHTYIPFESEDYEY